MSFFVKELKEKEPPNYIKEQKWDREVLLSTGGDEDGSPGVLIWYEGGDIGALLSTGNRTWKLLVKGQRPSRGQWAHIGIRWRKLQFTDVPDFIAQRKAQKPLTEMGGLEMLVDLKSVAHSLQPVEIGCKVQSEDEKCKGQDNSAVAKTFTAPELMLGCHKTISNDTYREFTTGVFDEVAIWERFLNATDLDYFMGGYSK